MRGRVRGGVGVPDCVKWMGQGRAEGGKAAAGATALQALAECHHCLDCGRVRSHCGFLLGVWGLDFLVAGNENAACLFSEK